MQPREVAPRTEDAVGARNGPPGECIKLTGVGRRTMRHIGACARANLLRVSYHVSLQLFSKAKFYRYGLLAFWEKREACVL